MAIRYRRDSFKNLDEFGSIIENLDDYRSEPVTVRVGDREILSETVHAMVNITQNRVTMPVSHRYPVFGHKEALGYVAKEIDAQNIGIHGFIDTHGDRTYTRVLFDGVEAKDDDSKVEIGMSFENPMDRKTRFRGYGYTWRQICSNGAGIKKMLPIMEVNERHTTDMNIRVPPIIRDFIKASVGQTSHMQNLINGAAAQKVVFESKEQLVGTLKEIFDGITEKHVLRIADQLELDPTRWDMFNAANFVTSHFPVTPDVRSHIDIKAELFLDQRHPIVPVLIVKLDEEEEIVKRPDFVPF